ncbi:MAG TPA: hypothetical protein ENJ06_00135 [Phycisphaeraceae bacterium]|nr:hypothetical protein [Phycisphaeraceae bacterium]
MSPLKLSSRNDPSDSSFLPEDYVEQRAERRTNVLSLTLFAIVMTAVIAAFLVTNRQWNTVKTQQRAINIAYTNAAKDIEQLEILQEQQTKMMHKAELTSALIERVPRSILLAELINRMPENVSLLEFSLEQKEPKKVRGRHGASSTTRDLKKKSSRRSTKKEEKEKQEEQVIEVPKYETVMKMTGIAPTDVEVSAYIAALNQCDLLKSVTLKYTENSMVEDKQVREFNISMVLNPQADARHIEPMMAQRSIESQRAADDLVFGELPDALHDADSEEDSKAPQGTLGILQKAYKAAKKHEQQTAAVTDEGGN